MNEKIVWGFDGDLRGNEKRIMWVWPFLRNPTGTFCMVRDIAGQTHEYDDDENYIAEFGTKITPVESIPYVVGKGLVVMGNEYIEHLQTLLPYIPALVAELDSFVTIQDGFRVKLLTLEEYQQLQVMIVEAAKSVFDQELFLARGVGVTGTGYHVLRVLYGTHSNEKMDYTLPHLIHARLMESEHRYTELLELVSADGIPVEVLRKLVDIRINIARAITDAMLNFEEEKG